MNFSFQKYLIQIGERSIEYTYPFDVLCDNIQYFKECYKRDLSAHKALLFLGDDIKYREHPIICMKETNLHVRKMKKEFRNKRIRRNGNKVQGM